MLNVLLIRTFYGLALGWEVSVWLGTYSRLKQDVVTHTGERGPYKGLFSKSLPSIYYNDRTSTFDDSSIELKSVST